MRTATAIHSTNLVCILRWAAGFACGAAVLLSTPAYAEDSKEIEKRVREEILQQLPQEIMKVLLQQNLLNRQIERGIEEYISKQQEAKAATSARREQAMRDNAKNVRRPSSMRDHVYGDPRAAISLIVYSDFECPHCKKFHATPIEMVDASAGRVNLIYRHFPLAMHNPSALKQAEASECAASLGGNEVFWKFIAAIYGRTTSNGNGFPIAQLVPLASELGLDGGRFKECIDAGMFAARVKEDVDDANRIGLSGTPSTVFVNNETDEVALEFGALPASAFRARIEKMSTTHLRITSTRCEAEGGC